MTRFVKIIPASALLAAAASLWLYLANVGGTVQTSSSPLPDVYVDQPRWDMFDATGELEKKLHAARLEKWPHEDAIRLLEPRLELQDQRQRHWQASADRGLAFPGQQPIHLQDNVVLQRRQPDAGLTVTTSELLVARSGDTVETTAPVVLSAGSWHFSSLGLHADLGRQRVNLLDRVQGTHE